MMSLNSASVNILLKETMHYNFLYFSSKNGYLQSQTLLHDGVF